MSGLVLNFVPDPVDAVAAMSRALVPGGTVAAYVWDYAMGMQLLPDVLGHGRRPGPRRGRPARGAPVPPARPRGARGRLGAGGPRAIETTALTVPTVFEDFEDYWQPFLGGQGPGPAYVASLGAADRKELRAALVRALPTEPDGRIVLSARAWAVSGISWSARPP